MTISFPSWGEIGVFFKLHTKSIIGVRMCSLLYVLNDKASKANAQLDLIAHQPHSADYGSITKELVALTSHYHPLYAQDNGNMYDRIERALPGTSHSSAIICFRRTRDGRGGNGRSRLPIFWKGRLGEQN